MILLNLLNDGGSLFMYSILAMLILVIVLIISAFVRGGEHKKAITIISTIGSFTLAFGVFGQILGLISAFDSIEAVGDVSTPIMAAGLKISLLSPLFGLLVFMVSRLGVIVLTWRGE